MLEWVAISSSMGSSTPRCRPIAVESILPVPGGVLHVRGDTKPVVQIQPSSGAVEYVGNMTLTCLVEGGSRRVYQWLKNGRPIHTSSTNSFSLQNIVCCSMSSFNCCFLICIQISQEAVQVVWYSHLFQNFPQIVVIHTVKGFSIVDETVVDVFLELFLLL